MGSAARHATSALADAEQAAKEIRMKQYIRSIGAKRYGVTTSHVGDSWSATIVPVPPSDGATHNLPRWQCDATSEQELNDKIELHFAEMLKAHRLGQ